MMMTAGASIEMMSASLVKEAEASTTVGPPVVVGAARIDEAAARGVIGARVIMAQGIERSGASTPPQSPRLSPAMRTRDLPGSPNPLGGA